MTVNENEKNLHTAVTQRKTHQGGPLTQTQGCCLSPHYPIQRYWKDALVTLSAASITDISPIYFSILFSCVSILV